MNINDSEIYKDIRKSMLIDTIFTQGFSLSLLDLFSYEDLVKEIPLDYCDSDKISPASDSYEKVLEAVKSCSNVERTILL